MEVFFFFLGFGKKGRGAYLNLTQFLENKVVVLVVCLSLQLNYSF